MLRVAAFVEDTEAEGPGRRAALWVQGCPIRCPGCCNPEMFDDRGGTPWPPAEIEARLAAARAAGVEGISVLGGEPFAQAAGVAAVAAIARDLGLTVMVYTGFVRADLEARATGGDAGVAALLASIDILVDGPYLRDQPEPAPPRGRRWIGSSNQVVHRLTAAAAADPRLDAGAGNTVELRLIDGVLVVNGWPGAADALRPRGRRAP